MATKIVNGQVVEMSDAEVAALTASLPGVAERRSVRIEAMKAERDRRRLENGYQAAGHWFHSDPGSRTQQLGLVALGANVPAVAWRTMGGGSVSMTQTLAMQILVAAAESDAALHAHGESLRATINASDTPETVDVYAGWPAGYGE